MELISLTFVKYNEAPIIYPGISHLFEFGDDHKMERVYFLASVGDNVGKQVLLFCKGDSSGTFLVVYRSCAS